MGVRVPNVNVKIGRSTNAQAQIPQPSKHIKPQGGAVHCVGAKVNRKGAVKK